MRYAIGVKVIEKDKVFDAVLFSHKSYEIDYFKHSGNMKEDDQDRLYLIVFDSAKEATTYSQYLSHKTNKQNKYCTARYRFYPVKLDTKEFPFVAKDRVVSEKIRYNRFAELNVDLEKSLGYYHYHEWKQK